MPISVPVPWKCQFCTLENPGHRRRCEACDQRKGLTTAVTLSSHDRPSPSPTLRVYVRVGNRRQSKGFMAILPPSTTMCLSPSDAIPSPPPKQTRPSCEPMEDRIVTIPTTSNPLSTTIMDSATPKVGSRCLRQESMGMFRYTPPSQEENRSNQPMRSATPNNNNNNANHDSHPNDLHVGSFHYTPPSQEMPPSRMKHHSTLDHSLSPLAARVLTTTMTTITTTATATALPQQPQQLQQPATARKFTLTTTTTPSLLSAKSNAEAQSTSLLRKDMHHKHHQEHQPPPTTTTTTPTTVQENLLVGHPAMTTMGSSQRNDSKTNSSGTGRLAVAFATAGTKSRIHVDAAQLQQAADLLREESNKAPLVIESSNAKMPLNNTNLPKAHQRRLQSADEIKPSNVPKTRNTTATPTPTPTPVVVGFQKAGSKSTIYVNEAQLRQAEHLLQKEDVSTKSDFYRKANLSTTLLHNHAATSKVSPEVDAGALLMRACFHTAGSKSAIQVDDLQLQKAAFILKEPKETTHSKSTVVDQPERSKSEIGFQRNSSRKTLVGSTYGVPTPEALQPPLSLAFTTAGSNNCIHVSQTRLHEARRLLLSDKEEADASTAKSFVAAIDGPWTAASEEHRMRASEVLGSFDRKEPLCVEFSTAGSKSRIQLSEAGLKRARLIFEAPETPPTPTKTSPKNMHDAASVRVPTLCEHLYNKVSASNVVDQRVVDYGNEEHRQLPTSSFARGAALPSSLICPTTTLKRKNGLQLHQPCTKRRVSFEPSPSHEDPSSLASSSSAGSNVNTGLGDHWFRKTHNKFDNGMLDIEKPRLASSFGDPSVPFQTSSSKAHMNVVDSSRGQVDNPLHECDRNNGEVAIQDFGEFTAFGVSSNTDGPKTRASVEASGLRQACDPPNLTPEARSNLEYNGLAKGPGFRGLESKENSRLSSNTLPSRLSVTFQTAGSNSEIKIDEQSALRATVILQSDDDACASWTKEDSNCAHSAITPAAKKRLLSKDTSSQSPSWKPSESLHVMAGRRFFPPDIESRLLGVKYPRDDQGRFPLLGHPIVTPRVSFGTPFDERANEHGSPDHSYDCELNLNFRFDQNLSLLQSAAESVHNNDNAIDSKPSRIAIPSVTPLRDFHCDPRAMTCETLSSSRIACVIRSSRDMYPPVNTAAVAVSDLNQPLSFQTNDVQNSVNTVEKRKCLREEPLCRNLVEALRFGTLCSCPEVWRSNGVSDITRDITAQNAQKVLFDAKSRLPATFQLSDTQDVIGSTDSLKSSLVERGFARDCLNDAWVENHKRWIVWKLAAYERSFCAHLGGKYLTFDRLLYGLARRYRVEIVDGKRPALRIILNRDAAASLPMILCVSEVVQADHEDKESFGVSTRLRLSDGWYEIDATLDKPLSSLVEKGVVRVGTKLLVTNASMRGADQGVDPLDPEYPSMKPFLLLTANSTRLAKWDSRLGFLKVSTSSDGRKFCPVKRVSDIVLGGGGVECLRILVLRRFPLMYLEKGSIGNATLSEAEEDERRSELERRRTRAIEKLSDAVTMDVERVRCVLGQCCERRCRCFAND